MAQRLIYGKTSPVVLITEGWGLSETSPVLTLNEFGQQQPGCVGTPLSDTDIQVWNEDNQPLPQGEVGELVIKGPQVMKGYWNRPEETERALFMATFSLGDVGLITAKRRYSNCRPNERYDHCLGL